MYNEYTEIKIKEYFRDIIEHKSVEKDDKLYINLKTSEKWDEKSAMAYQIIILYRHPSGYGRPMNFKCEKENENLFNVSWCCYNITD